MNNLKGIIFDIKHFAVHDGPGIRTTVFFKGCPLTCWWCHNPESHDPFPEQIKAPHRITLENSCPKELVGKEVTIEDVVKEVLKDRIFYEESNGGVTISGGEPLMQFDFLYTLLKRLKKEGVHTILDTSGYTSLAYFKKIIGLVDLYLFDFKLLDDDTHKKYTGVSNQRIKTNLEFLIFNKQDIIIRLPIIPKITDTITNIHQLGKYLSQIKIRRVDLLPYNRMGEEKYNRLEREYKLKDIAPPSQEEMDNLKDTLETFGLVVEIGG